MEFCVCLTYIQVSSQFNVRASKFSEIYARDENLFHLAFHRSGRFFWSIERARRVTSAVYKHERSFTVEFLLLSFSTVFSAMTRQFSSGEILYLRPGPVPLNGTNHLNRHSLSKYTHLYNAAEMIRSTGAFVISLAFLSFLTSTAISLTQLHIRSTVE